MPLRGGYSREAMSENIRAEMHAGRKRRQAVAIAYAQARREAKKRGKRPAHLEGGS